MLRRRMRWRSSIAYGAPASALDAVDWLLDSELLERKQQADGRWLLDRAYSEPLNVALNESVGERSRWNTLRVLHWDSSP